MNPGSWAARGCEGAPRAWQLLLLKDASRLCAFALSRRGSQLCFFFVWITYRCQLVRILCRGCRGQRREGTPTVNESMTAHIFPQTNKSEKLPPSSGLNPRSLLSVHLHGYLSRVFAGSRVSYTHCASAPAVCGFARPLA